MAELTIYQRTAGIPWALNLNKTVLTGPGNIFKACLVVKLKLIEYIVLKQVVMTVITMKSFLEKEQSQAPIY